MIKCELKEILLLLRLHHSWLITGFVTRLTRRVSLVERELHSIPEHLSSSPVISEVRVARSLVFCVCFVDCCLSFCIFLLAIVMSVLFRFTNSDYLPLISTYLPTLLMPIFVLQIYLGSLPSGIWDFDYPVYVLFSQILLN